MHLLSQIIYSCKTLFMFRTVFELKTAYTAWRWNPDLGFPCFSLSCKANARVKPAKTGHCPHSS